MKRRWLFIAALELLGADAAKENQKTKEEIANLQGTWSFVTMEVDGIQLPPKAFEGSKIVIKGTGFTTISAGAAYKGTFKVDITKKPKTLDLNFNDGPEKGNTSRAIYDLDGDDWKICLTIGAKERPKEFATKAGSGRALETLKRTKP
jgi:uncharacterized protein (TIGR03067 family)